MPSNPSPNTRTYMSPKPDMQPQNKPQLPRLKLTKFMSRKNLPWVVVAALLLISVFLYVQYHQAQNKLNGISTGTGYEKDLRKLILLPSSEKPTTATIKDTSKLSSQPFFSSAKKGDVLFVYNTSRKAILYRPSTHMIINVQPVSPSTKGS